MPRQPVSNRVAAVKAYYWARGCLPLATVFLALLTNGAFRGNAHQFIPYWVNNFELRGSVLDKPPPGRHSPLSLDDAWECCYLIQAGYKNKTGEQRYFRSIRQAVQHSPRLKQILGQTWMSQQGMLRRVKKACPELARRTLRFVRFLGPATKRARAAYAARMLSMVTVTPNGVDATQLQRYLARFMWIDSKTVYVVPKDHLVYAPPGADMYIEDERLPRSKSQIQKINYYVVVNAVLGPVYFKVVTGTTRIREVDPTYPAEGFLVSGSGCSAGKCIRIGGKHKPAMGVFLYCCHCLLHQLAPLLAVSMVAAHQAQPPPAAGCVYGLVLLLPGCCCDAMHAAPKVLLPIDLNGYKVAWQPEVKGLLGARQQLCLPHHRAQVGHRADHCRPHPACRLAQLPAALAVVRAPQS